MEKITSDKILDWVIERVEQKLPPSKDQWIEIAFRLNVLCLEEERLFNKMSQSCAVKENEILQAQGKRNVSAANLELRTTDEFRFMRDQQAKIDVIKQFIMIAKKSSDMVF